MSDYAPVSIAIPSSDGTICTYGGVVVVNVTVSNTAAPAADLEFYDDTSATGTLIGVVPANGANQTYPIDRQFHKAIYVKNVSGWVGSIGVKS